jgi:hypothetical protein
VAEWLRDRITYILGIDMVISNGQWWQNSSGIKSQTLWELTWSYSMVNGGRITQGENHIPSGD